MIVSDHLRNGAALLLWGLVVLVGGATSPSPAHGQAAAETGSSQDALNMYGDAANFQNNGAFELAVEEWGKFLKRFPDDPLAPKARHYLGVCNLQLKRFAAAAAAFQAVVQDHPTIDVIQDAYLNLGWCQYSLAGQNVEGMYAKASDTFGQLVKKFPDGKHKDQALFFLGEADYKRDAKQQAVAAYAQLVTECPESSLRADALYALGVTREELGQYKEAGTAYKSFLEEFPDSELATEVEMRIAETVAQAGDYAAAEKAFAAVAAKDNFAAPDHALYRQAYCLSKLERFDEAAAVYAKLVADFPRSAYAADSVMSASRCFYRSGQPDEAAKWFRQVVDADAANVAEAAHWLCRIYLNNGQPEKARDLAVQVLPKATDDPYLASLQMDRGDALYELDGSKPQAVDVYLTVVADHPDDKLAAQALYNAAFAELELGKVDEGLKHAIAFLEAYPNHSLVPDVKYVAAECHLQRGEYAEAEKIYRELTGADNPHPDRETWQVRLGLAIYLQKRYEDAIAALAELDPANMAAGNAAEAQFLIGASQFYLQKYAPAVQALRASLKADPRWKQSDEALLFLARSLDKQDKRAEALKTLDTLIADYPNSRLLDQAHYRQGECLFAGGNFEQAIAAYGKVLDGWPDSPFAPYALYNQGWAQLKRGDFSDATQTLTSLITNHPEHTLVADAQLARGMCLRQEGKYAEAIRDIDAYLATEPDATKKCDALYEKGLAQVSLQQYADAAGTFQQVLAVDANYANADKVLYELGWAHKSTGDESKEADAVAAFSKLVASHPDSPLAAEAQFHVGEAAYDAGKYDDAVKAYTAALEKSTSGDLGEKAAYKLGWAHYQLKDYAAAQAAFGRQVEQHPEGTLRPDGLFMKAECLFRQEDYEQALPVYLAIQDAPLSSATIEVLADLHGGQSASQLEDWEQAIALLSQIPEQHADSPYLPEAYYELGWAKQNANQQEEALQDYEQAAAKSRGEVGARARFMIGELYFARKEFSEAIRQFQRVMFGYGGQDAPAPVKKWQVKAAFEAARCAEVQIEAATGSARAKWITDAKRDYGFVVENDQQNELAGKAQERLEELSKLQ